ncbi:TlpA family protein disulfide reductase [Microbacterium sp. KUDC0406]|uniref:TlpA family protein disulfide reductase n=1 Tax=Microbacterium sp. KUDC0406 TaxID=2909588 RepID=UPI001F45E3B9|nr:TlpA disulfide reductase family protein [Microbacterium sp. KUDC0406]UJP08992.1 TlpA family protein disulfide reductase [Microbacterium sp. KUDC0406]
MSRRVRPVIAAALAAVFAIGLSACTANDPAADEFGKGDTVYSSNDIRVQEIKPADRRAPIEFAGTTEAGEQFDSADAAGGVLVVNFWYATCGPCRVEAKDLESAWQKNKGDGVTFVGVNIYDQADTAKAFNKEFGVTYPSIMDADSGKAKLAFAKVTPIQAPPVTLVLDAQGRVAARIVGPIDGPSVLTTLVQDILAEKA